MTPNINGNDLISDEVLGGLIHDMDVPVLEELVTTDFQDIWDYRIVSSKAMASLELHEEQLQLMGDTGWEFIVMREINVPFEWECWYYFKRKRIQLQLQEGAENGE